MANSNQVAFDDFIKKVKPDANVHEPMVLMAGYVGESPVEGHVRVYHDEALNHFTDIPKSDIAHAEKFTKEESPMGGSKLWVKQKAAAQNSGNQNDFLQGDLYQHYANQMFEPQAAIAQPLIPPTTAPIICNPPSILDIQCPTQQRTRCIPCLTQQQTRCIPCLTQQRTRCISCRTVQFPCTIVSNIEVCTITVNNFLCQFNGGFTQPNFQGGAFNPYQF